MFRIVGILIRIRKRENRLPDFSEFEVDMLSRVETPAHDLFLRLDMSYFEELFNMNKGNRGDASPHNFVTEANDGWWKTRRQYNYWAPLSANIQPVSEAFSVFATDHEEVASMDYSVSIIPSHPMGMAFYKQIVEVCLILW